MGEPRANGLLILHPRARRHRQLDSLLGHLSSLFRLHTEESLYPGHTQVICRQRLADFQGVVLTAGGDGTFHEAINAWAELGFPAGPRFAPLPLGSGNDFLYSIDSRLRQPQAFLSCPLTEERQSDLGLVTYQTAEGPRSRYFCVGATAGFSALVTFRRAALAQRVPGSLSYLLAMVMSLGSWRNTWCRIEGGDRPLDHSVFFNLNAANVKHYGGGMFSAPRADPFGRRLDAVSMNLKLPQAIRAMPENFSGRFDGVANVEQFAISSPLTLTTGRICLVQADGEPLGQTPMTVECLPAKLPILLPAL